MTVQTIPVRSTPKLRAGRFSFLDLARHIGAIHRQRQTLRALDVSALNDIGLTRSQANAEASRPIWDVPNHWLR